MHDFMDKVAVITGGAHGIGKAAADAFRREGAAVHIIDLQPGDWFVGDVGDRDTLERFSRDVIGRSGHVDFLINNTPPLMKGIQDCSWEEFGRALTVGFITGENICIDGGMTKLMIYHGEHGWSFEKE